MPGCLTRTALGLVALLVAMGIAGCASEQARPKSRPTATASSSEYQEAQEQVAPIYTSLYPNLSAADIAERESTAEVRAMSIQGWAADPAFCGVLFEFERNALATYGTTAEFLRSAEAELKGALPTTSTMTVTTESVR